MAAKKTGFNIFGPGSGGVKMPRKSNVIGYVKASLFVCAFALVLAGFAFLDGYVKKQTTGSSGNRTIELVGDVPNWVSEEIKNRIYAAATAEANNSANDDEKIAASAQSNIAKLVPWLADAKVQTTHKSILITGRWRKPLLLVTAEKNKFFIDADLVVLDYSPLGNLPVINITGLELSKIPPTPGKVWQGDDLAAAMAVLNRLSRMDIAVSPDKPLLRQIDRIDVANFEGRKNKREPHISLYTKDGTQIIWGAELGTWQRHLESPDDDKLAKLYTYYQQYGTLSGVKYINLRDPQQKIYLPVDKY
ncbi:MAG: cell division protein FtsQ/DivIB [Sedimentisphaerales bacterium]